MSEDLVDLRYELGERTVFLQVDEELFSRDVIYGAAYGFVDRCWLFLTRPSDRQVGVALRSKERCDAAALERLAGEFANELLNQAVRKQVGDATAPIRQSYMARAFFGDTRRASIDALLAELDAEELGDAPLQIEVPWKQEGQDG